MVQLRIELLPPCPFNAEGRENNYVFVRSEKGGGIMIGDTMLLCDDCGIEIDEGETYFKLDYSPYNVVCEDCVIRAEVIRGNETNFVVTESEKLL